MSKDKTERKTVADFPELVNEWHPTKNSRIKLEEITAGSNRKIWWKCNKGSDHEWEAPVYSRAGKQKSGCPFCAGRKVSETNSLASLFPEIAKEWHLIKNRELTPEQVSSGSGKQIWWKCDKGPDHEWRAQVRNRTTNRTGCPFCAGQKVSKTNSLASLFPETAREWHPTKNGKLTAKDLTAGSHRKVWWKCPKGAEHEWESSVKGRTHNKSRCPFCTGRKLSLTNSLASLFPEIAKEWHPTKNGKLTPKQVLAGTNKEYWWKCPKGAEHEWIAQVNNRTYNKTGCPFCAGQKVSESNSLASLFPEIAKEWHPTKNGKLTPEQVSSGSGKQIWWKCDKELDHEWEATIADRTGKRKSGCPFCAGRKVSKTNSLSYLFPEIAKEWHPIKNGDLTPNRIVGGSHKRVWWKCPEGPDHEWKVSISNRTHQKTGCPFCIGRKVSNTNSLASLFPEIAKEWHPSKNGDLTPEQVVAGSNKIYWWKCSKGADHEWKATIDSRTGKRKSGCPFCARKKLSLTNSLASLFPETAIEWHPSRNGELTPEQVLAGTHKKVWWKCDKGSDHEWEAQVNSRTYDKRGCPFCAGKEVSETNSLKELYPEIAKEWHPKKNGKLKLEDFTYGSTKKVWWKCSKNPIHEWETTPNKRTSQKTGCPYCSLERFKIIGYVWEKICHRIAKQLLKEEKWTWHPKIETPEVLERKWIEPEILIEKHDGSLEIIEVKNSPFALTLKDVSIYPLYAQKVIFWFLFVESSIEIDLDDNFDFVSSDELIEQLVQKITNENRTTISKIINDIEKLKEGTYLSQQKLLTEFITLD